MRVGGVQLAMRQLDGSNQRKYLASSERCNEQLKLAQARGMSSTIRGLPPHPPPVYDLQCAPLLLELRFLHAAGQWCPASHAGVMYKLELMP